MARPRIFEESRRQINIYLHNDQHEFLVKHSRSLGVSPSAYLRNYIDKDMGVERKKIGPQGTNKITKENI